MHPLNNFLGFIMTPQPGYAQQVGIPMLVFTGVWMVVNFVVMFVVPQDNQAVHTLTLGAGILGIPLGLLILSLRWAALRGTPSAASKRTAPILIVLSLLAAVGLLLLLPKPHRSGPAQPIETVTKLDDAVTYLDGHTSQVKALGVSPDGRTLVSAGMDGRVMIRDLPGGKLRRIALNSPHPKSAAPDRFRSLLLSPNSATALIGGDLKGHFYHFDLFTTESFR